MPQAWAGKVPRAAATRRGPAAKSSMFDHPHARGVRESPNPERSAPRRCLLTTARERPKVKLLFGPAANALHAVKGISTL